MSSSRMVFDGRRQPGRSNFVQTCNLLSRYIKEKGSLRDLNIEIAGKVESLQQIVKPGLSQPNSIEQQSFMAPVSSINAPMSKEDPKPSQLTIFYSGRVLVFDDYPSNKVEELVVFAKKESPQMSHGVLSSAGWEKMSTGCPVGPGSSSRDGLPLRPLAGTSSLKAAAIASDASKEIISSPTTSEANGSDLPIARRSSLHRFLEKRKDRSAVRGPYHQVQENHGSSSKGDDQQLELKL